MDSNDLKPPADCRWDCVSLGEVMLRLDPGEARIHTTRNFAVYEGGGEYNVARGLRRCFSQRTAIATAFADNPVGRLAEDLILQGGVDTSLVQWHLFDGVGREIRNGLNFTERGFGPRAAIGCYDRGHTAASLLKPGDFDWKHIFGPENGTRWFHTGGIFAALSASTREVAAEAIRAAKSQGVVVSYDLNYRESLWRTIGGSATAQQVNRALVSEVDVLFGSDFAALGVMPKGLSGDELSLQDYETLLRELVRVFPNLKLVATTVRSAHSASRNDWGGIAIYKDEIVHVPLMPVDILDRVGGGDAFAAGLIYGFLAGKPFDWALKCGVAHGALAMSTPGDTSMATLAEVERVMRGESARIAR